LSHDIASHIENKIVNRSFETIIRITGWHI